MYPFYTTIVVLSQHPGVHRALYKSKSKGRCLEEIGTGDLMERAVILPSLQLRLKVACLMAKKQGLSKRYLICF